MSDATTGPVSSDQRHPLTNLALGLAVASLVAWLALVATDADGPVWLVQVGLSAAATVTALMAGGRHPRNRPAFVALVIGVLGLLSFLGFLLSEL